MNSGAVLFLLNARDHTRGFGFKFPQALGRTSLEDSANLRPPLVNRARVVYPGGVGLDFQRGAMSALHLHEGAMSDEMSQLLRVGAELVPIIAGDPDVFRTF